MRAVAARASAKRPATINGVRVTPAIVAPVTGPVNCVYKKHTMGVASHLGIQLDEYDARIRTFIPRYERMLDVAADAVAGLKGRAHSRRGA